MSSSESNNKHWLRWAAAVLAIAALIALVRLLPVADGIEWLRDWVDDRGFLGMLVFAAAYLVAALLFVPGSALTLAAGAVFGLGVGTALVSVASTLSAALAFLIARYFARQKVEALAQKYPRFRAVDGAIEKGGWRVVALLRLSPAIPFSAGNYLYGLTGVGFLPYLLASWVAMLPGTFLYVYLGYAGSTGLQAVGEGEASTGGPWKAVLLVVGLLATIAVTVYVTRLARKALKEEGQLSEQEPELVNSDQQKAQA